MNNFLKRIKETERVIRQEDEFLGKVRKFKPKIQLMHREKHQTNKILNFTTKKKVRDDTPALILRTGIILNESRIH